MTDKIRPNDIVLHKPTGEKWVVAGVHDPEELISRQDKGLSI